MERTRLPDGLRDHQADRRGLTETGSVVGTLDYLAPEQIRGEPVDARTDSYALACVLYESLAGTPPIRRATEAETLWGTCRRTRSRCAASRGWTGCCARGSRRGSRALSDLRRADRGGGQGARRAAPRPATRLPAHRRIRLQGALLAAGVLCSCWSPRPPASPRLEEGRGRDDRASGRIRPRPCDRRGRGRDPAGRAPAQIAIGMAPLGLDANDRTISRIDPARPRERAHVQHRLDTDGPAVGDGASWVGNASPSSAHSHASRRACRASTSSHGGGRTTIRLPGGKSGPYFHGGGRTSRRSPSPKTPLWVVNPHPQYPPSTPGRTAASRASTTSRPRGRGRRGRRLGRRVPPTRLDRADRPADERRAARRDPGRGA